MRKHLIHHLRQGIVRVSTALKVNLIIPHMPALKQRGKIKEDLARATWVITFLGL